MDPQRLLATAIISATGLGLLVVGGLHALTEPGLAGLALVAFTGVLGLGFLVGGGLLYRSDLRSSHTLRVAGWNALGVIVTVAVLALMYVFQGAAGGEVVAPAFSAAVVVGVSAMAHVLIGLNDVRRIRAEVVADQRQKASVINRVVRHDLRHYGQRLLGIGDELRTEPDPPRAVGLSDRIVELGRELSTLDDRIEVVTDLQTDSVTRHAVAIDELVASVVGEYRSANPAITFETDIPADVRAIAGDELRTAIDALLENAVEYGGERVRVAVQRTGDVVHIEISDDGPGMPAAERTVVLSDDPETQLEHASGLGLWVSRWIVEAYGGSMSIPEITDGTTVAIDLEAA